MTKATLMLYIIAAACIILIVPAADWFADVVGQWMGVIDRIGAPPLR
jgi:hypothetical protein